ncbi:MAG: hypothetical protein JHC26_00820 [Thermofilum sp.]|jgi:hypothetical protein|uniref:hypothetical protein n=1 Tax=Thermofilum sp. TaxID=1961369 RepID=UPI0025866AD6|nr:hypothetical protein [Thermofilum sp.]MCI4407607.1 hypothetical protein [Thermofilum sp.]
MGLAELFLKKKAIIIGKDGVFETKNVRVFPDYLLIDGKAYPKIKARIQVKGLTLYYVFNEEALTKEQELKIDYLDFVINKRQIEQVFKAIISVTRQSTQQLIAYVLMGIFLGMTLDQYGNKVLEWLKTLPPNVVEKAFETLNIIAVIGIIGIVFGFLYLSRKK